MTPKKTRIIALILVGVLIFGLAATGLSALPITHNDPTAQADIPPEQSSRCGENPRLPSWRNYEHQAAI